MMELDYISLFSGIEAASVAWGPLGWRPAAFAEVDAFPSAVLAERFPGVPNLGDVTKVDWSEWNGCADVVIGGSPCQSFSVAGLRKGLADPRGNLMLEYLRACEAIDPEWVVWENVPGVLSSNGGSDFQALLEAVAELWPDGGCAWRVLDAQFFGVAQRRRRVFLVVNTRDWRRAAAVLQDEEVLRGNSSSSRRKREELARAAGSGAARHSGRGAAGGAPEHDGLSATCVNGQLFGRTAKSGPNGAGASEELAYTLTATDRHGVCAAFKPNQGSKARSIGWAEEQSPTLATDHPPAVLAFAQNSRDEVRVQGGNLCGALAANPGMKQTTYLAQQAQRTQTQYGDELAGTLTARADSGPCADRGPNVVCMASGQAGAETAEGMSPTLTALHDRPVLCMADDTANAACDEDVCGTLKVGGARPSVLCAGVDPAEWVVRGLTPVEAERLQGFPDGWTQVPYRGAPAADTPRFKALGNSMAVPVIRWLGERISMVDELSTGLMLEGAA